MDSLSYINKKTLRHIENKPGQRIIQVHPFMNLDQINGEQASRRTDVESFVLILIYFLKGSLPWEPVCHEDVVTETKLKKMSKMMQASPKEICSGLPSEFEEMLRASRNMAFDEEPRYFYFTQQLERLLYRSKA